MPAPAPTGIAAPLTVNPVVVWARQQGKAAANTTTPATATTTVTENVSAKATVS